MYTAIRHYVIKPGTEGEIASRAEQGFIPIISSVPGFVSYHMVDTGNNSMTTISVFDTQQGADESITKAAGWIKDNLADLLPEPPMVMKGQVLAGKVGTYDIK